MNNVNAKDLGQDHITRSESVRTFTEADKLLVGQNEEIRRQIESRPSVIKRFRFDNGKCTTKNCSVNSE